MNEPTTINDLSPEDRAELERWLDQYVSPLTYTEAELEVLAALDARKTGRSVPHEL